MTALRMNKLLFGTLCGVSFLLASCNRTDNFIKDQNDYWTNHLQPLVRRSEPVGQLKLLAEKENWTFTDSREYSPERRGNHTIMLTNGKTTGGKVMYSEVVAYVEYNPDLKIISFRTDTRAHGF